MATIAVILGLCLQSAQAAGPKLEPPSAAFVNLGESPIPSPKLPPTGFTDGVSRPDNGILPDPESISGGPPSDSALAELPKAVFALPGLLVEGAASVMLPRRIELNGQVLFDRTPGDEDFAGALGRVFMRKQMSFFSDAENLGGLTPGAADGDEGFDRHRFDDNQVRILFDSVKRAYRERFHLPSMDFDTAVSAVSSGHWIEAIALPVAISAYTFRFGLDRKWQVSEDIRFEVRFERGSQIYQSFTDNTNHHLASLAFNVFRLPVSAFVTLATDEGRLETSFLGLGTDLASVFECLQGREGE